MGADRSRGSPAPVAAAPGTAGLRQLKNLSEEEALRRLAGVPLGRIVFTRQALPAVRPVNHIVVDGNMIIRFGQGRILSTEVAAAGAVVAFEADELDWAERLGWSVISTGVAHPVTDPQDIERFQARLHPWVAGPWTR